MAPIGGIGIGMRPYRSIYSVNFDGANDRVIFGNVLDLPFAYNVATFSAWFKTASAAGVVVAGKCLSSLHDYSGTLGYQMGLTTDGRLVYYQRRNSTGAPDWWQTDATGYNDGAWHHAVWVKSAAVACDLYVDGALKAQTTSYEAGGGSNTTNASQFTIAARSDGSAPSAVVLDDVAVYGAELSAANVSWIRNSGKPRDLLDPAAPAGLASWWRMGDGDTYPTIADHGPGAHDGTMTNMDAGDIVADAP